MSKVKECKPKFMWLTFPAGSFGLHDLVEVALEVVFQGHDCVWEWPETLGESSRQVPSSTSGTS